MHFNEVVDAWPIGIGAPCVGCTEQKIAFRVPMFQTVPIHNATPPDFYVPVDSAPRPPEHGRRGPRRSCSRLVARRGVRGLARLCDEARRPGRADDRAPAKKDDEA